LLNSPNVQKRILTANLFLIFSGICFPLMILYIPWYISVRPFPPNIFLIELPIDTSEKLGFAVLSYALNMFFYVVAVVLLAGFFLLLLPGLLIIYLVLETIGNQGVQTNPKSNSHPIVCHAPIYQALQVVIAYFNSQSFLTLVGQTLCILYSIISLLLITKFATTFMEIVVGLITALFNIHAAFLLNFYLGRIFELSKNLLMTWERQKGRDKLSKLTLRAMHPLKIRCGCINYFDGGNVITVGQIITENYISILLTIIG
ncbi:unnamed protein product, partial [Allacma fusca]